MQNYPKTGSLLSHTVFLAERLDVEPIADTNYNSRLGNVIMHAHQI
jgi:hypothetical protein